jgi:hypothetical protein
VGKYYTAGQPTEDNIIRRIHIACGIPKATNTHSEYVILVAFLLKQLLQESASLLRYTHIACIVNFASINIRLYAVTQSVFFVVFFLVDFSGSF